jgi:hypothetical protein
MRCDLAAQTPTLEYLQVVVDRDPVRSTGWRHQSYPVAGPEPPGKRDTI